jgi:hypothetical protein
LGDDVEAEALAVALAVDSGGVHDADVDDTTLLADFDDERVEHHKGVGRAVQRAGAERLDGLVELACEPRDLALGDRLDRELADRFLDPARRHAGQVEVGDDTDQRLLGAPATVKQPVGEEAAFAQLRELEVDRGRARVPAPLAVAVALIGALGRALAPAGAAERVGLLAQERVDGLLDQPSATGRAR